MSSLWKSGYLPTPKQLKWYGLLELINIPPNATTKQRLALLKAARRSLGLKEMIYQFDSRKHFEVALKLGRVDQDALRAGWLEVPPPANQPRKKTTSTLS